MIKQSAYQKPKRAQPKGGSRKGIPNKSTKAIKDMVYEALNGVGGVEYFKQQAIDNPAPFMSLVGKILPKDMVIDANVSPITVEHNVKVNAAEWLDSVINGIVRK